MNELHCVTGALGFSGGYIARHLLERGHDVRTLTGSPGRTHEFGDSIDIRPMDFDNPAELRASLRGVRVLYNTYWVRFSKAGFSQADAVRNTRVLFAAACDAGVERIVHVSITNPSVASPYEYFRGKAALESALVETGLPHTILRPAVLFGGTDVLVSNIAWLLRTFPVFGIIGDGEYGLRPIHVDDLAALAVRCGANRGTAVVDAVGPETFRYREFVRAIAAAIGRPARLVHLPRSLGLACAAVLGWALRDVLLTAEEYDALADNLLVTDSPSTGTTVFSDWLRGHGDALGRRYTSEVARHKNRSLSYAEL